MIVEIFPIYKILKINYQKIGLSIQNKIIQFSRDNRS